MVSSMGGGKPSASPLVTNSLRFTSSPQPLPPANIIPPQPQPQAAQVVPAVPQEITASVQLPGSPATVLSMSQIQVTGSAVIHTQTYTCTVHKYTHHIHNALNTDAL